MIGCFSLMDSTAALAASRAFIACTHYMFGGLRAGGSIPAIFGAVLLAGLGVLTR